MRDHAEPAWTAVEAPEILLAVPRMREEAFVLALEIWKTKRDDAVEKICVVKFNT